MAPRLVAELFSTDIPWRAGSLAAAVHVHPSGAHARVTGQIAQQSDALDRTVAVGWRAVALAAAPTDDSLRVVLQSQGGGPIAVIDQPLPDALRGGAHGTSSAVNFSVGSESSGWTWASRYELSAAQVCVLRIGRAYADAAETMGLTEEEARDILLTLAAEQAEDDDDDAELDATLEELRRLTAAELATRLGCEAQPAIAAQLLPSLAADQARVLLAAGGAAPLLGGISFGVVLCGEGCTVDRDGRCRCEDARSRLSPPPPPTTTHEPIGGTSCVTALWLDPLNQPHTVARLRLAAHHYSWSDVSSLTYDASQCAGGAPFSPSGPATWLRMSNRRRPRTVSVEVCDTSEAARAPTLALFGGPCDALVQRACGAGGVAGSRPGCAAIHSVELEHGKNYFLVVRGTAGAHAPTLAVTASAGELPTVEEEEEEEPAAPSHRMRSLVRDAAYGVPAQRANLTWAAGTVAQRYRLVQRRTAPLFWVAMWRFYTDEECTQELLPEAATDGGHFGCCGTGCVEGVEVGACCCELHYRSQPCAAGECWLEVDFGAVVGVQCMEYQASAGDGDEEEEEEEGVSGSVPGLTLQVWSDAAREWVDPGVRNGETRRRAEGATRRTTTTTAAQATEGSECAVT